MGGTSGAWIECGELKVYGGDETVETVVGAGGELSLENLPACAHPARLSLKGFECGAEMFLDIGEVSCEMD